MDDTSEMLHQLGAFEPHEAKKVLPLLEATGIRFEVEADHTALTAAESRIAALFRALSRRIKAGDLRSRITSREGDGGDRKTCSNLDSRSRDCEERAATTATPLISREIVDDIRPKHVHSPRCQRSLPGSIAHHGRFACFVGHGPRLFAHACASAGCCSCPDAGGSFLRHRACRWRHASGCKIEGDIAGSGICSLGSGTVYASGASGHRR